MGMANIKIGDICSVVKPMHAINNAPMLGATDGLFHYLKNAGIPYSRLHDTGGAYGNFRFVDIENIFRNWDADENDEASYDFAFTDWLLEALQKQGVKPFYRLGTTIENQQCIKAYRIYPPKDFKKWARICEHIIAHYNEGWANGYHMGIEYWEIWNEPDNYPDIADNQMWKGTFDEYIELYKVTSLHLRNCFGNTIKIGGYASCGFYYLFDTYSDIAKISNRTEYFVECFHKFMKEVVANKLPLDFFSWHSYSDVSLNVQYADYVRGQLDNYGYCHTESILNEWNPGTHLRGTLQDSANISSNMIALQYAPLDMLMYYDGQVHGSYQGMYNPVTYEPFKSYYIFKAFSKVFELRNCRTVNVDNENIYCIVSSNENDMTLMITNLGDNLNISIENYLPNKGYDVYRLDEGHNLEVVNTTYNLDNLPIGRFETILIKSI